MTVQQRISQRERDVVLGALRAGVSPQSGHHHIQVGRANEVEAVLSDLARIADDGAAFRLIVGNYGSGKTFFLSLARKLALDKRFVTMTADISPHRRLQGGDGMARSLYQALVASTATRTKPDGGALPTVVDRLVNACLETARQSGEAARDVLRSRLASLTEMVGGYEFSEVINAYWRGHESGDDVLKASAIQWLRGEITTKTDARQRLGVRNVIDDSNLYDHLKLLARLARLAGFAGLLVCLDEMVCIYRLANTQSRTANYEHILYILNECTQGTVRGCGFLLGATPESVVDPRRGLYSYAALQSRLSENPYAKGGLVDFSGPMFHLATLTKEDMYILLSKLRHLHAYGDPDRYAVPDDALIAFMEQCGRRVGDAYFRTPRNTVREFIQILDILEQNPEADWRDLLGQVTIELDTDTSAAELLAGGEARTEQDDSDELAAFRIRG